MQTGVSTIRTGSAPPTMVHRRISHLRLSADVNICDCTAAPITVKQTADERAHYSGATTLPFLQHHLVQYAMLSINHISRHASIRNKQWKWECKWLAHDQVLKPLHIPGKCLAVMVTPLAQGCGPSEVAMQFCDTYNFRIILI